MRSLAEWSSNVDLSIYTLKYSKEQPVEDGSINWESQNSNNEFVEGI